MKQVFSVPALRSEADKRRAEEVLGLLDGMRRVRGCLSDCTVTVRYRRQSLSESDIISELALAGYTARLRGKHTSALRSWIENDRLSCITFLVWMLTVLEMEFGYLAKTSDYSEFLFYSIGQIALLFPVTVLCVMAIYRKRENSLTRNGRYIYVLGALCFCFAYTASAINLAISADLFDEIDPNDSPLLFETAALIPSLILLGEGIESVFRSSASRKLHGLFSGIPATARVVVDDAERLIASTGLPEGGQAVVGAGERVPCDGVVAEGAAMLDTSALDGAITPTFAVAGTNVYGGCACLSGSITVECAKNANEMRLTKIRELAESGEDDPAPIERKVRIIGMVYAPLLAILSVVLAYFTSDGVNGFFGIVVNMLLVGCPCTLAFAVPAAIAAGKGKAADAGLLFRDAESLQALHGVETVLFHVPGTLSQGELNFSGCVLSEGMSQNRLIAYAASMLKDSRTEEGDALVRAAGGLDIPLDPVSEAEYDAEGASGVLGSERALVGSLAFMERHAQNTAGWQERAAMLYGEGSRVVFVASAGKIHGLIALRDALRGSTVAAVKRLNAMGLRTVIIGEGGEETVRAMAQKAQAAEYHCCETAQAVEQAAQSLTAGGKTVLAVYHEGRYASVLSKNCLSLGMGSECGETVESAKLLALHNDLRLVPTALELVKKTLRIARQNLFWSLVFNLIGLPIASGLLVEPLGLRFTPAIAALLMFASGLCIVINALRLHWFQPTPVAKRFHRLANRRLVRE